MATQAELERWERIAHAEDQQRADEIARIMALSETELEAEGDSFEAAAARGRAAFERAKIEVSSRKAIQVWLKCPREKRPSPEALGQLIASIVRQYPN